jgi:rRNA maturation endonuclease Nob1
MYSRRKNLYTCRGCLNIFDVVILSAPELGADNPDIEWCPFCGEEIDSIENEDIDPSEEDDDDFEEY